MPPLVLCEPPGARRPPKAPAPKAASGLPGGSETAPLRPAGPATLAGLGMGALPLPSEGSLGMGGSSAGSGIERLSRREGLSSNACLQ